MRKEAEAKMMKHESAHSESNESLCFSLDELFTNL